VKLCNKNQGRKKKKKLYVSYLGGKKDLTQGGRATRKEGGVTLQRVTPGQRWPERPGAGGGALGWQGTIPKKPLSGWVEEKPKHIRRILIGKRGRGEKH